eukprot:TRINITY_DN9032_c0_g1_i4.p1 TRINITY_DN9032_c0_g1~~TRINITY_DN9032_c0_g1_i4.p1  ORF type:complete len:436 (-),score=76.74 TRINITY_DN9032_c0_g1_i4:102-1364(-)
MRDELQLTASSDIHLTIPASHPDTAFQPFQHLPIPVLKHILSFSSGVDLARFFSVSQDFRQCIQDRGLWEHLVDVERHQLRPLVYLAHVDEFEALRQQNPRGFYYKMQGLLADDRKAARDQEAFRKQLQDLEVVQNRYHDYYAIFQRLVVSSVLPALLLLFIVLLALHLDGRSSISMIDAFAPLYALLGFLFCAIVLTCWALNQNERLDLCFRAMDDDYGLIPFTIQHILPNSVFGWLFSFAVLSSLALFIIFLSLKLGEVVMWSWSAVYAPLFVTAVTMVFFPLIDRRGFGRATKWTKTLSVVIPLTIFVVLLCIKLDGNVAIPIEVLLIPLWIMDATVLAFSVGLCVEGVRTQTPPETITGILAVILIVPWVIFKVLLVLHTHQMYVLGPITLLAPLIAWFALLCVLFSALGVVCFYN